MLNIQEDGTFSSTFISIPRVFATNSKVSKAKHQLGCAISLRIEKKRDGKREIHATCSIFITSNLRKITGRSKRTKELLGFIRLATEDLIDNWSKNR